MKHDFQCILCRNKKYNTNDYPYGCNSFDKCYSLNNLMFKIPGFRKLYSLWLDWEWKRQERYYEKMEKKYGDYSLENDDVKFIFGVLGMWPEPSDKPNLFTMNDLDICYDKKKQTYDLGIELFIGFETPDGHRNHLNYLLEKFTDFMKSEGYDTDNCKYSWRDFFYVGEMSSGLSGKTLEEVYWKFKMMVLGINALGLTSVEIIKKDEDKE